MWQLLACKCASLGALCGLIASSQLREELVTAQAGRVRRPQNKAGAKPGAKPGSKPGSKAGAKPRGKAGRKPQAASRRGKPAAGTSTRGSRQRRGGRTGCRRKDEASGAVPEPRKQRLGTGQRGGRAARGRPGANRRRAAARCAVCAGHRERRDSRFARLLAWQASVMAEACACVQAPCGGSSQQLAGLHARASRPLRHVAGRWCSGACARRGLGGSGLSLRLRHTAGCRATSPNGESVM